MSLFSATVNCFIFFLLYTHNTQAQDHPTFLPCNTVYNLRLFCVVQFKSNISGLTGVARFMFSEHTLHLLFFPFTDQRSVCLTSGQDSWVDAGLGFPPCMPLLFTILFLAERTTLRTSCSLS